MKALILILPFLIGCSTVSREINELPQEAKQGCYAKKFIADGMFPAGTWGKDAVFCSPELPDNYCYRYDTGNVKASIGCQ